MITITIDGLSANGKSTLANLLAKNMVLKILIQVPFIAVLL